MSESDRVDDRIGDILYLRTNYSEKSVRRTLADQYGFTDAEIGIAFREADRIISDAGAPNITNEIGLLMTRNEQLYQKAVTNNKGDQAAQLLRDRLAILTRLNPAGGGEQEGAAEAAALEEQIETARGYLERIEGTRKGLPIEDLARDVMTRFVQMEKCRITETNKQSGETP